MNEIAHPRPSGSREDHLAILHRIAAETGATKPADLVWKALEWAVETVDRLDDRERSWQRNGRHSNWRIPTGLTRREAAETERLRVLSGMRPGDDTPLVRTARNEEEALLALEWFRLVQGAKDGDRLEAAALVLLRGDDRQKAAATYRPGRKYARTTNYELRQRLTGMILNGLRDQFAIVLEPGALEQAA